GGAFLTPDEVGDVARALASGCRAAVAIAAGDNYAIEATIPDAPVYRLVCGDVWYHIDAASGAALEKLDSSRRAYRWFYSALHTLDFPALLAAPAVRTVLIVALCIAGLAFSLSGVVIGWLRLPLIVRSPPRPGVDRNISFFSTADSTWTIGNVLLMGDKRLLHLHNPGRNRTICDCRHIRRPQPPVSL